MNDDPSREADEIFAELRQRLADHHEDRKQQYRDLLDASKITGLSIESLTQMRPDEIAIVVSVAQESEDQWVTMHKSDSEKHFGVSFSGLKKRKPFRMKNIPGTRDVLIHPDDWENRHQ